MDKLRLSVSRFSFLFLFLFPFTMQTGGTAVPPPPVPAQVALEKYLQSTEQKSLQQKFSQALQKAADHPLEQDPIGQYRIILVRGIFTNLYTQLMDYFQYWHLPVPEGAANAFHAQGAAFTKLGWDVHMAPSDTQQSTSYNGAEIARLIQESDRPVILVTHSKGGLDALSGLIDNPELQPKVAAWIALQTPFYGSPLIDCLLHCPVMDRSSQWILQLLGGKKDSLGDMDGAKTRAYLQEHREEINLLTQKTPILSVGSFFQLPTSTFTGRLRPLKKRSLLEPLNNYILSQKAGDNDGMVPPLNACLPDTPCLVLEQMDHAGPVMEATPFQGLQDQERIHFLLALVSMLLNH